MVVGRKKRKALAALGKLACEVCGFDFAKFYGDIGEGYAECHHILPLSSTDTTRRTKLADLAIVCANCHRILHRSRTWLSIVGLRAKVIHTAANQSEAQALKPQPESKRWG
jgi:5-methylcytosine-specific restriction enzyme A